MIEGDVFLAWLDSESEVVAAKLHKNETLNTEDKLVMVLKAQTNHFHHLDVELRNEVRTLREDTTQQIKELREDTTQQIKELREDTDKRFEQVDKRFEQINSEIKNIYRAINGQTWKMISAVGLIVVLSKVVELFG